MNEAELKNKCSVICSPFNHSLNILESDEDAHIKNRKSLLNQVSFSMQHQEFESPPQLQDTIKCFWYNSREHGRLSADFDVMPDGYAEIIFYFGSTLSILHNGVLQPLPSPFMMGLLNQPAVFNTKNRLEIIGIRCFPWSVFDLLGLASGNGGVQRFEHSIAQLQTSLDVSIQAGRIEDAINQVKEYFLQLRTQISTDSMLSKAGIAMRKANGTLPVSGVASAAHTTIRTLERKFKQSSGRTVKDVSALIRFEQARNQLWMDPDVNLAGLAHELGYTDQSHLSREFKRYSGVTPGVFARNAKKEKRIMPKDFVAFIQA